MAAKPTHLQVRLLRLPTRAALAAAHGVPTESHRMLTVVGLHMDHDLDQVAGWGECSALNEPGYTSEWAEGAFELLRSGQAIDTATHPMASAALEMAHLDASLKMAGESLSDRLGTTGLSAPAGAVVGLAPLPNVLDEIEELVEQGYQRVKCKIAPDRVSNVIEAVHATFPELELHVDANGSLTGDDVPSLLRLGDLGVRSIEQPFAVGDHTSAARLVAQSNVEVVADEAVTGPDDVQAIARDRAATGIVVKPSKLGGIQPALDLMDHAHANGLNATVGGMLESGLGRHVLAAFAPLDIFTITGDVSPAKRWLTDDPFPDIVMRRGVIAAPSRPGIAGDPAMNRLDRHTVRQALVAL